MTYTYKKKMSNIVAHTQITDKIYKVLSKYRKELIY